jgi:chaperonin GroES
MVRFRPLHDRVLVRRVEAEAKTPGGIIIPDTVKEKPVEAEVVAVGPGSRGEDGKLHPLDVKPGDRVLFAKWSGTEVVIGGEDRLILKEADILGILEGAGRAAHRQGRRYRSQGGRAQLTTTEARVVERPEKKEPAVAPPADIGF